MRCSLPIVAAALFVAACGAPEKEPEVESSGTPTAEPAPKPEPTWIPLFNGRDLDGWVPKIRGYALGEDPLRTFRVEDGLLRVSYAGYEAFEGRFGHLFFEQPFNSYDLRLEYRFVGEQTPGGPGWAIRNSGAMLHCQPPETMSVDQDFPVSVEAQLLGEAAGTEALRPTSNLCTPGTHVEQNGELITQHCVGSSADTYRGDEWVTVVFEVRGGETIRHLIDGEVVLEYGRPQLDPGDANAAALLADGAEEVLSGGWISLQAESHPIDFRRVELRPVER